MLKGMHWPSNITINCLGFSLMLQSKMYQRSSRQILEQFRKQLRNRQYRLRFHQIRNQLQNKSWETFYQPMQIQESHCLQLNKSKPFFMDSLNSLAIVEFCKTISAILENKNTLQMNFLIEAQIMTNLFQILEIMNTSIVTDQQSLQKLNWKELAMAKWWTAPDNCLILIEISLKRFLRYSILPDYSIIKLSLQHANKNHKYKQMCVSFLQCYRLQQKISVKSVHHKQLIFDYMSAVVSLPCNRVCLEIYNAILRKVNLWKLKIDQQLWIRIKLLILSQQFLEKITMKLQEQIGVNKIKHVQKNTDEECAIEFVEIIATFILCLKDANSEPWSTVVPKLLTVWRKYEFNLQYSITTIIQSRAQSLRQILRLIKRYKRFHWSAFI